MRHPPFPTVPTAVRKVDRAEETGIVRSRNVGRTRLVTRPRSDQRRAAPLSLNGSDPGCDLPDTDDRHVLAAAIHSECDLLVTENTRDFPDKSVEDADLLVITVDDALTSLAEEQRDDIKEIVATQIAALRRPPSTVEAFIDRLAARAPNAAMTIGSTLGIAKYERILADTRDARGDRGPQEAVRRLLDR